MSKRLLLIEDEPNIIEAISFILSRDGWQVTSHVSGRDAVDRIRREAPDVVILDVMLPGKSGYDVLQEIRNDDALSGLPVLMLTARGQDKDRELALRAGADRFMTKPFSNTEVLEAVRAMVPAA
ncbi:MULTISPECIES: response regulator transcription factor [unclassified Roseivivax]|uniref:response regulator transcription factor n=1 Tax=Roseivivax sp. GX 12232 TaxID=2900547 RepID=UPI001E574929|nr:response regulator [Roseivivax sp. GX 12232]MCE0506880.1 response regulator [Roseivivax sp. GX 12232]